MKIKKINVKYDESEDIIETFDVEPGLKERVKKTTDLYQKIIEGNKNMFTSLKMKKMDQSSGKLSKKEAAVYSIMNEPAGDNDDIPMPEED